MIILLYYFQTASVAFSVIIALCFIPGTFVAFIVAERSACY